MKRIITTGIVILLLVSGIISALANTRIDREDLWQAENTVQTIAEDAITISVPYAILMEKETGTVIFEKQADTITPPASVAKVMTMLLIVEEVESGRLSLDDNVTTSAHAAGKGGSQIYLEEGEQMTARDMLKAIVVSSANDASVAMAEHIAGTEEAFVARMNERARELGMTNTTFKNSTGLPIEGGDSTTTARDVALMSRALIQHEMIKEFTTIWMDSVRGGEFGLTNTNRLIYYYDGATGLKTGFTQSAMYCLSATAERDGVTFIAVVMHGETSDDRFESAKALLNFAFANYTLVNIQPDSVIPPVRVEIGTVDAVQPVLDGTGRLLLEKVTAGRITQEIDLVETVPAPVVAGQQLGTLTVYDGDAAIATIPIIAADDVGKMGTFAVFGKFARMLFTGG